MMVFFGVEIPMVVILIAAYLLWVIGLIMIKKVLFVAVRRLTQRTKTQIDDVLIEASDTPLFLLIFTSGGILVSRFLPGSTGAELVRYGLIGFKAIAILAAVLFIEKLISGLLKAYADRSEILKTSGGVTRSVARIVIFGLGGLVLLDSFGISVTPIIASLGIGSLAVALALQPTLENFFAGIQMFADKPVQPGQFVRLESGQEGYVHKVGWRSTWVRMLPNNMVIIPNKTLINSQITNYYYPERELAVLVEVGVHYDSDLERVEKITIEVAKDTLKAVPGAVENFEPFIRFHTFADFSINFSVILRAKEFTDGYLLKHEFIKRLHKRYAKEGIVIPYPIRAINYAQEKAFEK